MPLTRVDQGHHWSGCFVACIAMVTGTSYEQAFKLLFPKRRFENEYHGIRRMNPTAPANVAYLKMSALGLQPKRTNRVSFDKLNRTAIWIIRWSWSPELMHAVVWDHQTKTILDPAYSLPLPIKEYEKQRDSVYYVEPKSHAVGNSHAHTSNDIGGSVDGGRVNQAGRFTDPFDSGYSY